MEDLLIFNQPQQVCYCVGIKLPFSENLESNDTYKQLMIVKIGDLPVVSMFYVVILGMRNGY